MGLCCCKAVDDEPIDDRIIVHQPRNTPVIVSNVQVRNEIQTPTHDLPPTRVDAVPNRTAGTTSHDEVHDDTNALDAKKIQSLRKELHQQILVARREKRRTQSRKKVESNEDLLVSLIQSLKIPHAPQVTPKKAYTLEPVYQNSKSYTFVMACFSNRKFINTYEITCIKRIWNPYLLAQYTLKKNDSGSKFNERHLFHGTDHEGVLGILMNNLDWRKVKNGRYGWGVSFANNPWYASHYCKKQKLAVSDYVMVLAKVLIEDGEVCQGNTSTIYPSTGHTTTNANGEVLVKYDDATFYPEFVVYFRPRMTMGYPIYYY